MSEYPSHIPTPVAKPRLAEARSLWMNPVAHELRPADTSPEAQVASRNVWLDRVLDGDPNRPLPHISLEARPANRIVISFDGVPQTPRTGNPNDKTTSFMVKSPEGETVGFAIINKPEPQAGMPDKHYIADIRTEPHKGYGPATYLTILKALPAGTGLRTEGVMNDDAKRVWEDLAAKGVARRVGKPDEAPTRFETIF